jgi:hypothetical protein
VPFMKRTTGAEPTASVMAVLVSSERKRRVIELAAGMGMRVKEGRAVWRNAWGGWVSFVSWGNGGRGEGEGGGTDWNMGRAKDAMVV